MNRGKDVLFTLQWNEDDVHRPNLGEGISRTSDRRAVLWDVCVVINGRPMTTTIRAVTKGQALKFSKNRYPNATSITSTGKHR